MAAPVIRYGAAENVWFPQPCGDLTLVYLVPGPHVRPQMAEAEAERHAVRCWAQRTTTYADGGKIIQITPQW